MGTTHNADRQAGSLFQGSYASQQSFDGIGPWLAAHRFVTAVVPVTTGPRALAKFTFGAVGSDS